jgi:hypothetical protein
MMSFGFRRSRRVVTVDALREMDIKKAPGVVMDEVEDEDMKEVEEYPPLVLTVER